MAIDGGVNAALLCAQILAVSDPDLQKKLDDRRARETEKVLEKDRALQDKLAAR